MSNLFRVAVLASGSKGNATYIGIGEKNFLIDIGICVTELKKRLSQVNISVEDLDGVFITHEHNDHIKGLETFANNFDVPIYTSEPTWRKIVGVFPDIARKNCKLFRGEKTFNGVQVISFPTSHDAVDSHGYSFLANGKKMTYVTDLGFVTPVVQDAIENCEVLIIESNHDIDMLKNGSYPDWLKKRILSTQGHLANIVTADTLARLKHLPEEIFLAHLSQHNNNRELAFETTDKCLRKSGSCTKVLVASQNEVVANF